MHNHNNDASTTAVDANLERRTAIKQLAIACGLGLSSSSLSSMAESFLLPMDATRKKQSFFTPPQLAMVRELGEIIIPATDTPGAIGAEVHDFIDHQLAYCFNKDEQQMVLAGLERIAASARKNYGREFLACEKAEQTALLTQMERKLAGFTGEDRAFIKQLKALVVFGYYTSEPGASKELAYLAIPGAFKGSVKFATISRNWALN